RFVPFGTILRIEFHRTNRNLAYKQVPPWLLAAVEAVHVEVDEIAIGYLRNTHPEEEDVTAHIDDIRRIYDSYRPLMHRKMPQLAFPLIGMTKAEVLARLSPELAAHCVYCEMPVREGSPAGASLRPCGKCRTCEARRRALEGES